MDLSQFPGVYFLLLPRRRSSICEKRLTKMNTRSSQSLRNPITITGKISWTILLFMMVMQLIPENIKRNYQINTEDLNVNWSLEMTELNRSMRNRIQHAQNLNLLTHLNHTIVPYSFLVHITCYRRPMDLYSFKVSYIIIWSIYNIDIIHSKPNKLLWF